MKLGNHHSLKLLSAFSILLILTITPLNGGSNLDNTDNQDAIYLNLPAVELSTYQKHREEALARISEVELDDAAKYFKKGFPKEWDHYTENLETGIFYLEIAIRMEEKREIDLSGEAAVMALESFEVAGKKLNGGDDARKKAELARQIAFIQEHFFNDREMALENYKKALEHDSEQSDLKDKIRKLDK